MTISWHNKNNPLQKQSLVAELQTWANINTSSENLAGLLGFCSTLKTAFNSLGGTLSVVSLPELQVLSSQGKLQPRPSAAALHIVKRPEASLRVLLGGHMDTVFPSGASFQKAELISKNKLQGPGVADMKGGLLVLLKGLQIFEGSLWHKQLGWEILITPDEEIGSMSSRHLWLQAAKRNHLCLLFEPSLADGCLISSRKGSMNIAVVAHGKAAHSGREFLLGRNAIVALSHFITKISQLGGDQKGTTINIGAVSGGSAVNTIADLAMCHINIRASKEEDLQNAFAHLEKLAQAIASESHTSFDLHVLSHRSPKNYDRKTEALFDSLKDCASKLGIDLHARPSGGTCDGNLVAAEGVPTIDSLGAIGDNIHTEKEFIFIDSLVERAQLLSSFLMQLASQNNKSL